MHRILYKLALLVVGVGMLFIPATAAAWDPFGGVDCSQAGSAATSSVCSSNTTTNPIYGPDGLIVKIANIIAVIAGAAAVIVIIIAGFKYITASGEAKATSEAKNTLIYALVGLVVIALARALVTFVVSKL